MLISNFPNELSNVSNYHSNIQSLAAFKKWLTAVFIFFELFFFLFRFVAKGKRFLKIISAKMKEVPGKRWNASGARMHVSSTLWLLHVVFRSMIPGTRDLLSKFHANYQF